MAAGIRSDTIGGMKTKPDIRDGAISGRTASDRARSVPNRTRKASSGSSSSDVYDRTIAATLRAARARAGLTLRELALRAGTSHSALVAYEQGRKSPSVATFLRIIDACGFATDFELSPRIRERDGLARGRELEEVLNLAAQFPARHAKTMRYPKFGRR